MNKKRSYFSINIFQQCRELQLTLWQCPGFLFVVTGFVTIILIWGIYMITNIYYPEDIVIYSIITVTLFMSIIIFLVNRGLTQMSEARRALRKTNEELKKALVELQKAEQMRKDFTSMMVHDLRSPISGIKFIAEVLQEKQRAIDEKIKRESIEMIEGASQEMLDLINNFLDLAKIEAGKFEIEKTRGDLLKTINQRLKYFSLLAKNKNIRINLIAEKDLPLLDFDKRTIDQVLNNLISNSLKFTPIGGQIDIQVVKYYPNIDLENKARELNLGWFITNQTKGLKGLPESVLVAITDNGHGVPKEIISRLFKKFEQFDSSKKTSIKGTGLGLVISKKIIEAHKGIIGLESIVDEGSTFYFTLPLSS